MSKKRSNSQGIVQNDAKHVSDEPIDEARTKLETSSPNETKLPEFAQRVGSPETAHQAKERMSRAQDSGASFPLAKLAGAEAELKHRSQAIELLSAPKPKSADNDLLVYQLRRSVNTGQASNTIAAKIRRDTLSLYAALDSRDPIESIINRHIVTMSNGAMECQARAVQAGGSPKTFDVYSRHAEKMTRWSLSLSRRASAAVIQSRWWSAMSMWKPAAKQ